MAATLNELRKRASALGLRGYSKLRKPELEKLIAATQTGKAPAVTSTPKPKKAHTTKKAVSARIKARRPARKATAQKVPAGTVSAESIEEQIESAKFRLAPPGRTAPVEPVDHRLHEPIDHLPAQRSSALYLLPQKPGVLHACWQLRGHELEEHGALILRLSVLKGDALHIVADVPVRTARGHWYFNVPASLDHAQAYLALGYERNGQFVSAIAQGVARIPSLYAAARIDRRWWISDTRFREMYLRAGGFRRDEKLGWDASISSR